MRSLSQSAEGREKEGTTNPQNPNSTLKQSKVTISVHHNRVRIDSLQRIKNMETKNGIGYQWNWVRLWSEGQHSNRCQASIDDVNQIIEEAPDEMLEEIVFQSLTTDELYLRARAGRYLWSWSSLIGKSNELNTITRGIKFKVSSSNE